jgi:hypothetical protein
VSASTDCRGSFITLLLRHLECRPTNEFSRASRRRAGCNDVLASSVFTEVFQVKRVKKSMRERGDQDSRDCQKGNARIEGVEGCEELPRNC